ncbi:MAG: HEPN domain-containing protein [Victivallaceae bacterium]
MKPHEEWLFKAEHDLESAKILFESSKNLNDTAIYHTQQCAEKSLKAYLASNNIEIIKTHDLKILLTACSEINRAFNEFIILVNFLSPFASFFRYPGFEVLPENETVQTAIEYAEKIYDFVKDKINV